MPRFVMRYTVRSLTRQEITIEADSAEDAIAQIESYDFENSDEEQIDSFSTEFSDVECVREI